MHSTTHSPSVTLDLAHAIQDEHLRDAERRSRARQAGPRTRAPIRVPRRRGLRAWRPRRRFALA